MAKEDSVPEEIPDTGGVFKPKAYKQLQLPKKPYGLGVLAVNYVYMHTGDVVKPQ